ncbi:MAG: dihydropteroate synthase [Chloroflexi bacterium]|nr:dihydropteroate synthase [Chloroflexota bacterium]
MLVIANNISTRRARVNQLLRQSQNLHWDHRQAPALRLKELVQQCVVAGADVLEINTQQHFDEPEAMEFAITELQEVARNQLCLSTNNPECVAVGLKACKIPPIVNYVSFDLERLQKVLPLIARHRAEVVLLVTAPGETADAETMLKKSAILVGAANEAGIANSRIYVDPGIVHVTRESGQHHFREVLDFLQALPATFEPEVRSTCWLSNVSTGAPAPLRHVLETTSLAMLAAVGLSSAFMDVLRRENRRMARLIKIFRDETIYSDSDVEL